jgi:hypothetical protein
MRTNTLQWAELPTKEPGSEAADLRSGFTAGMYLELGEDPLGVVAGGMYADFEFARDGLIRAALREEVCHLDLSPRKAESFHQLALVGRDVFGGKTGSVALQEGASKFPQLMNRAMQALDQGAITTLQVGEGSQEIGQFGRRRGRPDRPAFSRPRRIFAYCKPRDDVYRQSCPYDPRGLSQF